LQLTVISNKDRIWKLFDEQEREIRRRMIIAEPVETSK
jgi:hypothetical protein